MKVEAFQLKYTAEEMQQLFDHVKDKHNKIDLNAEEIEKIKEQIQSIGSIPSYDEEELQAAILDIINAINSEEKTTAQKEE